jgi:hypothetical protein
VLDEVFGTEEAQFLAAEGDKDECAPRRRHSEESRELEHGRGAGRIIVCPSTNGILALRIERSIGRATQVIEMRADDDELPTEERISTR